MAELSKQAQKARMGLRRTIIGFALVFVLCVVIWALTGQGYFWPAWPLAGMLIGTAYAWFRISRLP